MTERVITREYVRELLDYDPATGVFVWKAPLSRRVKIGQEAGVVAANGRRYISADGRVYMAHHLAWLYVYGEFPVGNLSPKNGDYLDIRIDNLKPETAAETARRGGQNRSAGKSGVKGVSYDRERDKWIATVTREYRSVRIGRFDTKEAAEAAYIAAAGVLVSPVDAETKTARAAATRQRYLRRMLWNRTTENAGGMTGWSSIDAFSADVGAAPSDRHILAAIDPSAPIGPGNFAWVEKAGFDHGTPEGRAAYGKAHRTANPLLYKKHHLHKSFGIDLAEYQRLFVEQKGVCAICAQAESEQRGGKTKWLAVDHDHSTGAVRGLLCTACNKGIGLLQDSVAVLTSAIAYLKVHTKSADTAPDNVVPLMKKDAS